MTSMQSHGFPPSSSEPAWQKSALQEHAADSSNPDDLGPGGRVLSQLSLAASKIPRTIQQQPTAAQHPQLLSSCDLQGIAHHILSGKARRIVVMAGAGISVSSGIPDFRSPGTGLYSQLERFNLPWPEAVFDIRFFRHNPKPFYLLAKELFPGGYMPTPAHHFMRLLHDKGLLLTTFTQNIDGLEQLAGVPPEKVVPAHGSFDGAHCIDCGRACSVYAVQQAVFDDDVTTCSSCGGLVKPDIVFFGEKLPARFHRRRLVDLPQADLLIVMGTSLVVQPFGSMIDAVPEDCPRLLINMTKVGEKKQQQQQQPAWSQRHKVRHNSSSSDSSSDSSSGGESEADETGSCSGFESDATGLTASSSFVNAGSSSDGEATDTDAAEAADAPDNQAGERTGSSGEGGFDFSSGTRDALHLGECDVGVLELAALLGWEQELAALIKQGVQDFEEARAEWDE